MVDQAAAVCQKVGYEAVFFDAERGGLGAGVEDGGEVGVGKRLPVRVRVRVEEVERLGALKNVVQFPPEVVSCGGGNQRAELEVPSETAQGAP